MIRQVVRVTLSYLFMATVCVAYALSVQVIYEWATAGLQWRTAAALAAATLLAAALSYPRRLYRSQADEFNSKPEGLPIWMTRKRPLAFKLTATAASIVAGLAAVFLAQHYIKFEQVAATAVGEMKKVTLSDGSTVHVDARSKIKIKYTRETRIVHVYEGGAVFDVERDAKRPFIVRTYLADITAVGTRFGVTADSGVTATVSEGTVKITRHGIGSDAEVLVAAGQEFRVPIGSAPLASAPVTRVDAERRLQWATGYLRIEDWTVAEIAAEFNRRNRTQIIVDSPSLGARVVKFASFKVSDPQVYAEYVAAHPGVRMTVDEASHVIRLSE